MKHKFIVVQTTYLNGDATRTCFGIAAVVEYDGVTTVLESVSDLSAEIEPIKQLVERCNIHELELVHLQDVVIDFLVTA